MLGVPVSTWNDRLSLIGTPEGCIATAVAQPQTGTGSARRNSQDLWIGVSHDLLITTL